MFYVLVTSRRNYARLQGTQGREGCGMPHAKNAGTNVSKENKLNARGSGDSARQGGGSSDGASGSLIITVTILFTTVIVCKQVMCALHARSLLMGRCHRFVLDLMRRVRFALPCYLSRIVHWC